MAAVKKKICLIGSFAVGKTSLVRRFVSGIYKEEYLTTVGVKVDQKAVDCDGAEVRLMIWDLAGRDEFARVKQSYLKGSEGFLFVADGTRRETVDEMLEEVGAIEPNFPGVVSVALLNKADLTAEWELEESDIEALRERFPVWVTSALSGDHVEEAFLELTRKMLKRDA